MNRPSTPLEPLHPRRWVPRIPSPGLSRDLVLKRNEIELKSPGSKGLYYGNWVLGSGLGRTWYWYWDLISQDLGCAAPPSSELLKIAEQEELLSTRRRSRSRRRTQSAQAASFAMQVARTLLRSPSFSAFLRSSLHTSGPFLTPPTHTKRLQIIKFLNLWRKSGLIGNVSLSDIVDSSFWFCWCDVGGWGISAVLDLYCRVMHLRFWNPRIRFSGARASIAEILSMRCDRNSMIKCDEMSDEISVLLVVAMFGLTCQQGFWWETRDDFPWITASTRGTFCGGIHFNILKDERLFSSRRIRNTKKTTKLLLVFSNDAMRFKRLISDAFIETHGQLRFLTSKSVMELIAFEWWRCILCCSCRYPSLFKKSWNNPTRLPMFYVNLQLSRFVLEVIGALAARF